VGLNQAEKGTLGKAFWTVVELKWFRNIKVQQINGTEHSAIRLEQEGCEMELE
jgi:hypothetical protein